MANHLGSEGLVKVAANTVAELRSWSLEEAAAIIDDSELSDLAVTNKAGRTSWSGSIECWWDESDTTGQGALLNGTEVTLHLQPEGAVTGDIEFTGLAIISRINRAAAIDGIVECNFDFVGNGALTEQALP